MPLNVPYLTVVLPEDVNVDAIYDRFRAVLDVAPMTKTELAEEIGVSQATVSRWAAGDARPGVEKMLAAVEAMEDRIAEVQRRTDSAREALEACEEAIQAREQYEENKTKENLRQMREAGDEVRQLVGSRFEEG